MPSSYFVDFTAYIDETRRPENFPHEVHDLKVFNEVESVQHLQYLVNKRFVELISSAGLIVMKDPNEPVDESKITFDRRIFVPWHLVTYMKLDVHHMPAKPTTQDSIVPPTITPEPTKELIN